MHLTPEERKARQHAAVRRYYRRNREKLLAKQKQPDKKAKQRAASHRWILKNPGYHQKQRHRFQERLAGRSRPDHCEICAGSTKKSLAFDHSHQKGHFRGWICHNCNVTLGLVRDSPDHLRKLIAYLERSKNYVSQQFSLPGI